MQDNRRTSKDGTCRWVDRHFSESPTFADYMYKRNTINFGVNELKIMLYVFHIVSHILLV